MNGTLKLLLLAGAGSFIGGVGRFALGRFVQSVTHSIFPWGTFAVNVTGSFIIGLLFGISLRYNVLTTEWKVFLIAGICGGFTTFSSFSLENLELLKAGHINQFFLYTSSSVLVALVAVLAGYVLVK
jgi:CrcB protein